MTLLTKYFDHNASTPLDPQVLEAMLPYLRGPYGNPSSLHRFGRAARDGVERARAQVAALVGADASEVIFTSGGTEANNLAIKGLCGSQRGLLWGASEHPSVLEAAHYLQAQGVWVEAIALQADGQIHDSALRTQSADGRPKLVSLMHANNETGVIHDPAFWAQAIHSHDGLLHVDTTQTVGKIAVSMPELGADLLTLSSHKIYGPKGVGALVKKAEVELCPTNHGGGQEHGLRGGTENFPAIVGFGVAAELTMHTWAERSAHTLQLRQQLEQGLAQIAGVQIFAAHAPRLPNTCQFQLAGWDGEALLMHLDKRGFAVSSGSACASGNGEPSHVLLAMGVDPLVAKGAVRVSLGRDNTELAVAQFLALLAEFAQQNS